MSCKMRNVSPTTQDSFKALTFMRRKKKNKAKQDGGHGLS